MCILIFLLVFLLKKENLNNILFVEVFFYILGIFEIKKVLVRVTFVYNIFVIKN